MSLFIDWDNFWIDAKFVNITGDEFCRFQRLYNFKQFRLEIQQKRLK